MRKTFTIFLIFFISTAFSQITINGDLTESAYTTIGTKQNSNNGFGTNIDVSKIVYYVDTTYLYLGVEGKLDVTNNNGIGLWINVTGTGSPSGKSSGQSLGIQSTSGHYIGANNTSNVNFKADFEVDYMFAFNPGSGSSYVYFDAAKHVTSSVIEYQGSCDQLGNSATNSSAGGSVFSQNSITFAFNNSGTSNKGLELKIPLSQLGATTSHSIEVFAFVVSSTAYFSDVTVPGNVSSGNLGFNPDFSSLIGGLYHTNSSPLPIQLNSFYSIFNNGAVNLYWSTATEVNNYGFEIEKRKVDLRTKSINDKEWKTIGFVQGNGNSNSLKIYSFVDKDVTSGVYYYRLKQIDFDGTINYSDEIKVVVNFKPEVADIKVYPNPFNPVTTLKYQIPEAGKVRLTIYDLLGRELKTLTEEFLEEGIYETQFIADDLPSGIYLAVLNINGKIFTQKLQLVK